MERAGDLHCFFHRLWFDKGQDLFLPLINRLEYTMTFKDAASGEFFWRLLRCGLNNAIALYRTVHKLRPVFVVWLFAYLVFA